MTCNQILTPAGTASGAEERSSSYSNTEYVSPPTSMVKTGDAERVIGCAETSAIRPLPSGPLPPLSAQNWTVNWSVCGPQ